MEDPASSPARATRSHDLGVMEDPASSPARSTRSMTEIGEPPVNGTMGTGEIGPDALDVHHEDSGQLVKRSSSRVAKLKEQASVVNLESLDANSNNTKQVTGVEGGSSGRGTPTGTELEGGSVASSETSESSNNVNNVIVAASVDVDTLAIRSQNRSGASPSAGSTADDESAGSSVESSSGTSTPVKVGGPQSSILYNILTAKLKKRAKKNVDLSQVITNVPKVSLDESVVRKTFECRHCSRLFLKEYDFKQHERCHMVSNEKPFQCPQCGKRFVSNSKLNIHMRVHTGEQPYQCETCDRRFMTHNQCRKHSERCQRPGGLIKKSTVVNLLEVPKNKKKAAKKFKLSAETTTASPVASKVKESSKSSDEDKLYKCMNCYHICRNKETFVEHIKMHKEDAALDGLFTCKKCGKCYERSYNLKKHMKLHDGSAPHACKLCSFRCLRKYTLQIHMEWHRSVGGNKKKGSATNNRYKCKVCKKTFPQASNLIFHMKGHKDKTPKETVPSTSTDSGPIAEWPNVNDKMSYGSRFAANCPYCKKHFTRKFDLLRHIKTHAKNLQHTCKYCDSTFLTKTNFIKHMQLHTTKDYHYCRRCGLVYTKKVERHRQEKLCWFKTSQALVGIKGKETSESSEDAVELPEYWDVMKPDPITCEYCDLTFSSKSNLYTHMRRHGTGHTCHWCGLVYMKKKQQHDPKFNCWLKTRQGIMKKEKEKLAKTGYKPVAILEGKVVKNEPAKNEAAKDSQQQKKNDTDKGKKDLWRFQCKYCDWAFVDSGNRFTHQRLHEDKSNHYCRWCGLLYQQKRQKHDRNSRCWLTTVDGRLQKAKADKKVLTSPPKFAESAGGNQFQCPICNKSYEKETFLKYHLTLHSEVRPFACNRCDRTFKMQANLDKHLRNHTFQCEMCRHRFANESEYNKHVTKVPHNYKCQHCDRCFVTLKSLSAHNRTSCLDKQGERTATTASGSLKFPCKICGRSFDRSYSLAIHARYSHKEMTAKVQKKQSADVKGVNSAPFACSYCEKTFPYQSIMLRHMKCHMSKAHKCKHCGVILPNLTAYHNHLKSKHGVKLLKCKICNKLFADKSALDAHLVTHTPERGGNTCTICGKEFVKRMNYLKHVQIHSETTHICNVCGASFVLESLLNVHKNLLHSDKVANEFSYSDQSSTEEVSSEPSTNVLSENTGVGSFMCHGCKRRFKQRGHLVWHQKSRPDCATKSSGWSKKTSKCRFCMMSFANSARLMIHIKNVHRKSPPQTHSQGPNNGNIQCPKCSSTFTKKWSLNRHMQQYHQVQVKPNIFRCQYCDETSKRLDFHVAHEKLHTENIYKIQCVECKVGFKNYEDLEEHTMNSHEHGNASSQDKESYHPQEEQEVVKVQEQKDVKTQEQKVVKVVRPFLCRYCNLGFEKEEILHRHEKTHAEESRPYSCHQCGMKFRRLTGLTKHESIKHPDHEQSESDSGKPKAGPVVRAEDYKETSPNYTCKGCNKEFIRQNTFDIHEKKCLEKFRKVPVDFESDVTEPIESPVELPQVGTSSGSQSSESDTAIDLSMKAVPASEKKTDNGFKCEVCEQTFVNKQGLELHARFHTGAKPFQCAKCDESFPRKDYLVRHDKKHNEESIDEGKDVNTTEVVGSTL